MEESDDEPALLLLVELADTHIDDFTTVSSEMISKPQKTVLPIDEVQTEEHSSKQIGDTM